MKFDGNLVWQQASAAVSANRDVVLALAGVFFMLPSLGLALIFPPPQPAPNAGDEAILQLMSDYYLGILPYAVPLALFQATGTLALLTLLTDRSRPTVGQAIGFGVRGIVPYVLSQILLGLCVGAVGGTVILAGMVTGAAVLTAAGIAVAIVLAVYAAIRTSLAGPVIVVEGERNPVNALLRSWSLTRGNTARIGLFYLLVGIAFMFVIMVILLVTGILLSLLGSAEAVKLGQAVIGSGLEAVLALYFVGIIAAAHRQLAGSPPGSHGDTFG